MSSLTPVFSANQPCEEVLPVLRRQLGHAGLRVMQTFDLHSTRPGPLECPCPHHGTAECDCQMIVLLVYGSAPEPATLILHGNDGQTWLSMADQPRHTADVKAIREALKNPV